MTAMVPAVHDASRGVLTISEADLARTVAGLLGLPGLDKVAGQDLSDVLFGRVSARQWLENVQTLTFGARGSALLPSATLLTSLV